MATSYDDIEVRRPDLARSYLALMQAQPGRPLAMFAPRRVGKTHFLDHDLAPAARALGWLPVYADLWLQRSAPLDAINHALEEALDDAQVAPTRMGRIAGTPVKKIGLLGAEVEIGEPPTRRALPAAPALRLDALVARLAQAAGGPVLLMLDEIQSLAEAAQGDQVLAALRAVLHKRRGVLHSVFTGSSQEALARMLSTAGAPMYQFAQILNFPVLGDEFLQPLARHFAKVHRGKSLDAAAMRAVFERIGFKPALMRDLVKAASAEGIVDLQLAVQRFLADDRQVAGFRALLEPLAALDRSLLWVLAHRKPPFGRETLAELRPALPGDEPTTSKLRAAMARLARLGLLSHAGSARAELTDPLFAEYLQGLALRQLL
ncbi:MAG: hypothetical protein ACOVOT_04445 [Rubrivivax sp.]|jgi:hypothetical protein